MRARLLADHHVDQITATRGRLHASSVSITIGTVNEAHTPCGERGLPSQTSENSAVDNCAGSDYTTARCPFAEKQCSYTL